MEYINIKEAEERIRYIDRTTIPFSVTNGMVASILYYLLSLGVDVKTDQEELDKAIARIRERFDQHENMIGQPGGEAALDNQGLVPHANLPRFIFLFDGFRSVPKGSGDKELYFAPGGSKIYFDSANKKFYLQSPTDGEYYGSWGSNMAAEIPGSKEIGPDLSSLYIYNNELYVWNGALMIKVGSFQGNALYDDSKLTQMVEDLARKVNNWHVSEKLNDLSDVDISSPKAGEGLFYTGTAWINKPLPTEFAPSSHTHKKAEITDFPTEWAWSAISGKPATFAPSSHTHTFASCTSKPTTLSGYGITDAKIENGKITLGANSITPLTAHQSLSNYVTLNGEQTISGKKTFSNPIVSTYASGQWIKGVTNAVINANYTTYGAVFNAPTKDGRVSLSTYPGSNNSVYLGYIPDGQTSNNLKKELRWEGDTGTLTVDKIVKKDGTPSQFLKADGSVDSNTYAKTSQLTDGSVTKIGTATKGSASLPIYLNGGVPTACTASSIFSSLTTSGDNISITVAGQNRTLTVPYATSANQLKTSRTLWGQSFNGTANVSGNMTGVGSISASGRNTVKGALIASNTTWGSDNGHFRAFSSAASNPYILGFGASEDGYGIIQSSRQNIGAIPLLINPKGGNVGINTTAPGEKLEVNGNIKAASGVFADQLRSKYLFFTRPDTTKGYYFEAQTNGGLYIGQCDNFVGIGQVAHFGADKSFSVWGNIMPGSGDNSRDLGSSSVNFRNGYMTWVGSGSGKSFGMGANNATILTIATNGDAVFKYPITTGTKDTNGGLEIYHSTPYIDFHYGRSTADYTTRLIEDISGRLKLIGTFYSTKGIFTDEYVSARGQNTSSDERLKKDISTYHIDLETIARAPSVNFTWKDSGQKDIGSIAQYWKEVSPLLTPENHDGTLTLQYGKTALICAISTAAETVELKKRVADLEKEIKNLKKLLLGK